MHKRIIAFSSQRAGKRTINVASFAKTPKGIKLPIISRTVTQRPWLLITSFTGLCAIVIPSEYLGTNTSFLLFKDYFIVKHKN